MEEVETLQGPLGKQLAAALGHVGDLVARRADVVDGHAVASVAHAHEAVGSEVCGLPLASFGPSHQGAQFLTLAEHRRTFTGAGFTITGARSTLTQPRATSQCGSRRTRVRCPAPGSSPLRRGRSYRFTRQGCLCTCCLATVRSSRPVPHRASSGSRRLDDCSGTVGVRLVTAADAEQRLGEQLGSSPTASWRRWR